MSVPNLQSKDQKSTGRVATLATLKDAPLIIVKELMKNTGLLQVDGNFEFLDFLGDCPSPIQTSSGGCRFRVPPAPSAEDPPMPSPCINLSLDKDQMDFSASCLDYFDFRWPEGVAVFAAAHPFDECSQDDLSQEHAPQTFTSISNPAVAVSVPTAPGTLVLHLEFGKSYFLSVDPKFVHPSAPDVPAEHPARDFQSDVYPGLFELQPIVFWTTHAVPFASGPGRLPGWSQHDSDRKDDWGFLPYWWCADTKKISMGATVHVATSLELAAPRRCIWCSWSFCTSK